MSSLEATRVMELRIRLERLAARVFDRSCSPPELGRQTVFSTRVLFLLVGCPAGLQREVREAIELCRHVYTSACDVLHARDAAIGLPHVVVHEWAAAVARLEELEEELLAPFSRAPGPPISTKRGLGAN